MAKKELVKLSLRKVGMDTIGEFKIDPEIEQYFANASKEGQSEPHIETSTKWLNAEGKGLQFYKKTEKMSNKVLFPDLHVIDNFGNGLVDVGGEFGRSTVNVAILRAVGASEGVTFKLNELVSYEEVKTYLDLLGKWLKLFYAEYILGKPLETSIAVELDEAEGQV